MLMEVKTGDVLLIHEMRPVETLEKKSTGHAAAFEQRKARTGTTGKPNLTADSFAGIRAGSLLQVFAA